MPTPSVKLVNLPQALRKGIKFRLPPGHRFKNLAGKRFKRCQVVALAGFKGRFAAWLCRCECGKPFVAVGAESTRREGANCGWAFRLTSAAKELQRLLTAIKARCDQPSHAAYSYYGGRGITVCRRWRESTKAFAEDMGPRPSPRHVVVRRNKSANYTRANCYWGTMADVLRGSRRVKEITLNGKTQGMGAWAKELGISRQAVQLRVIACEKRGLDPSLAITYPKGRRRPRR